MMTRFNLRSTPRVVAAASLVIATLVPLHDAAGQQYYYQPPRDYYHNDTASGTFMGGALAGIVEGVTGNAFLAYASIFALEAVMLCVALGLSFRLNLKASTARQDGVEVIRNGPTEPATDIAI
jgi:hypothetical protein